MSTLAIPERAVVGLVGPNGAGKSTLLHLATGLISPSEGALRVLGKSPGSSEALSDVAFVAQNAPLPARMRVRDVVALARDMNERLDDDSVDSRIDALGLDRRHRIGELSGGQRASARTRHSLSRAWVLSERTLTAGGRELGTGGSLILGNLADLCPGLDVGPGAFPDHTAVDECLADVGVHQIVRYHPADRFWTFQLIESGLLVGLAAGAICVAVWGLARRTA